MRYRLSESSGSAFTRWSPLAQVDEGMAAMKAAVAAALDHGLFYSTDVYAAVAPQFEFTDEETGREVDRVVNGVVGMEIYYARRAVEAERAAKAEAEVRARLAAQPDQILPAMKMHVSGRGYRIMRKAKVTAIGPASITIEVKLGGRAFAFSTSAVNLENGIKKASERMTA